MIWIIKARGRPQSKQVRGMKIDVVQRIHVGAQRLFQRASPAMA
jgi:hypothetical protein